MKKPLTVGALLFSTFTTMSYVDNARADVEILCNETIAAWKSDRSMNQYLATYSCSCPNRYAAPVCTNHTGGTSSSSSSSGSNQRENEIKAAFVQSLLDAIISNGVGGQKQAHNQPASIPNPKYLDAVNRIAAMRLPPDKAKFLLDESLRSQRESSRLYNPGSTAFSQLGTSYCLSQQALFAVASYDRSEEASWLMQQSAGAMDGSLVEASPGKCSPPAIPPASPRMRTGTEPTEQLRSLILKVGDCKEAHKAALKKNESALAEVTYWRDAKIRLKTEADTAKTDEERKEKDDALQEALRMLDAAKQNQENSQKTVASTEKALQEAEESIRNDTDPSGKGRY